MIRLECPICFDTIQTPITCGRHTFDVEFLQRLIQVTGDADTQLSDTVASQRCPMEHEATTDWRTDERFAAR